MCSWAKNVQPMSTFYKDSLLTLVDNKLTAQNQFFARVLPYEQIITGRIELDSIY